MTRKEFDKYCGSLKSTTHVVQWEGESVWKIGGKIFAIHSGRDDESCQILSIKCSELNFQILRELEGIIPAPYLARGNWVQIQTKEAMSNDDVKDYIKLSYDIISKKLTKKLRDELGIANY